MRNVAPMQAPSEDDFLAVLDAEPIESHPRDGLWVYRFEGPSETHLVLSFNVHQASVQTTLFVRDVEVFVVVVEMSRRLVLLDDENGLLGEFDSGLGLEVRVHPALKVSWVRLGAE